MVVQWVRTYWTARSQGAPGAVLRNSLPEAFPLPDAEPPFVHEVRMYEGDGFTPHATLTGGLPPDTDVPERGRDRGRTSPACAAGWAGRPGMGRRRPPSRRVDELVHYP
ncbi:hypothetical protein GCM10010191_85160 [Actinomadura vinacea]|uniref:Uncharacterized protein n=1 Tax=Actinomadura vinacea TaxID=115336 RepID=A0ABN3KCL8_9ACTN